MGCWSQVEEKSKYYLLDTHFVLILILILASISSPFGRSKLSEEVETRPGYYSYHTSFQTLLLILPLIQLANR
jgi:hypothetical protein